MLKPELRYGISPTKCNLLCPRDVLNKPRHFPRLMRQHFRSARLRRCLAAILVSLPLVFLPMRAETPATDGIALAVVFDTSGSMNQPMATKAGGGTDSKYRIAQRAFGAVIDRLEAFSRSAGAKPLSVGIYVFRGNDAIVAKPLARFDAAGLRAWLAAMRPTGATPLGDAMFLAGRDLLAAPAASRHLLIVTDGANTAGRKPDGALDQLNAAAEKKQTPLFTHVIAVDIKPETFSALKKRGATLIGAADEAQLNAQFDFILEERILVEAPR